MKKTRLVFGFPLLALLFHFSVIATPSYAAHSVEVIDEEGAYQKTKELCSYAVSTKSYFFKSLKSFRYFWSGLKTGGFNPLMPSKQTMALYRNRGYWRALDECYGEDDVFSQYTFSIAIGLLDDLGGLTDAVIGYHALKALGGLLGASRFVVAHSVIFARVGRILMGVTAVAAVHSLITELRIHFKHKKMAKEMQNLESDPGKVVGNMVEREHEAVTELLKERVTEILNELKSRRLTTEKRSKLQADLANLRKLLQERDAQKAA